MTRVYYKESHGCIIMLDLTSRRSLESVKRWKADLDSKIQLSDEKGLPTLLLANKCDIADRAVTTAEVEELFLNYDFLGWCEVSAKRDVMVTDAVRFLVDSMIEQLEVQEGSVAAPKDEATLVLFGDEIKDDVQQEVQQ